MKNSFIRLLLRDIKNYIRTNRFFLIAEAALFLIGCMIADMQKPDSYGKYTTIQYYMQHTEIRCCVAQCISCPQADGQHLGNILDPIDKRALLR